MVTLKATVFRPSALPLSSSDDKMGPSAARGPSSKDESSGKGPPLAQPPCSWRPLPGCGVRSRKLKQHVRMAHSPLFFMEGRHALTREEAQDRVRALQHLAKTLINPEATLGDLMDHANISTRIPNVSCPERQRICRHYQQLSVPRQFPGLPRPLEVAGGSPGGAGDPSMFRMNATRNRS